MLDGLVAQAVHLTDSFDYDEVASRMSLVTKNYRELADLTHVVLPGLFPERVRSNLLGRALALGSKLRPMRVSRTPLDLTVPEAQRRGNRRIYGPCRQTTAVPVSIAAGGLGREASGSERVVGEESRPK